MSSATRVHADTKSGRDESDHSTSQATTLALHSRRRAPRKLREHTRTPQAPAKLATIAMNATGAASRAPPPPEPIKGRPELKATRTSPLLPLNHTLKQALALGCRQSKLASFCPPQP